MEGEPLMEYIRFQESLARYSHLHKSAESIIVRTFQFQINKDFSVQNVAHWFLEAIDLNIIDVQKKESKFYIHIKKLKKTIQIVSGDWIVKGNDWEIFVLKDFFYKEIYNQRLNTND